MSLRLSRTTWGALDLGATLVDDRRHHLGWAVMADPEGNEFCILDTGA